VAPERPGAIRVIFFDRGTGLDELPGLGIGVRIAGNARAGSGSGDALPDRLQDGERPALAHHGAGHRARPQEVNRLA
jgi:hypothetical protein